MPIRMDYPGRMEAIEHWWIDRQIDPLTDYQMGQIDRLIGKTTAAIAAESDPLAQDGLYQRLGDFEAKINFLR